MAHLGWTRDEALHYLNNNANWKDLQRSNAQAASDLSTTTLRRYAGRLWQAEKDGETLRDRAALRGHRVSENKPKNAPRKPGFENWQPPVNIKRGEYALPRNIKNSGTVRVTSGEATAVRALAQAAASKGRHRGAQIGINITGSRNGQYKQLFWRGGWDAAHLLEAAGYQRAYRGRWRRAGGSPGLEDFLLDYLAHSHGSPDKSWRRIRLYEVFVFYGPDPQLDDRKGHYKEVAAPLPSSTPASRAQRLAESRARQRASLDRMRDVQRGEG